MNKNYKSKNKYFEDDYDCKSSKNLYVYSGAVKCFDNIVADKWYGETYATSESKARNNLAFQYKKENGLEKTAKVTIPGKIIKEGI